MSPYEKPGLASNPERAWFGCVPLFWLEHLTDSEVVVALGLFAFADRTGHAKASVRTIAQACGKSRSTVARGLDRMIELGLLSRLGDPGKRAIYYAKVSQLVRQGVPPIRGTVFGQVEHKRGTQSEQILIREEKTMNKDHEETTEGFVPTSEIWERDRKRERPDPLSPADREAGKAALDRLRARYVGHPQPAVEDGEKSA